MKKTKAQIGRILKRPSQPSRQLTSFPDLLKEAASRGDRFAPNLIKCSDSEIQVGLQEVRSDYKSKLKKHPGAYKAVMGLFFEALAQAVLINKDEEPWLVARAIRYSVIAQNHMLLAWLWLPQDVRVLYAECSKFVGVNKRLWEKACAGSFAVARFTDACLQFKYRVRVAHPDHDLHRKIDLFYNPLIDRGGPLCVQVKSHAKIKGAQFTLLRNKPRQSDGSRAEYNLRLDVWNGVERFNRANNTTWLPLIVLVGLDGLASKSLYDAHVIRDLRLFVEALRAGSRDPLKAESDDLNFEQRIA